MAKTGVNPLKLPALTELDIRVLGILGRIYSEGSNICPESFVAEEHLQILLETGDTDALYEIPSHIIEDEVTGAAGDVQAEVSSTVEEAAEEPPKRTQMNSEREQFAVIARKQADAIMIQAESAKQQADASKQLAEAALLQANAFDRIACALERLAISLELYKNNKVKLVANNNSL